MSNKIELTDETRRLLNYMREFKQCFFERDLWYDEDISDMNHFDSHLKPDYSDESEDSDDESEPKEPKELHNSNDYKLIKNNLDNIIHNFWK